jgi:hypothetical protein
MVLKVEKSLVELMVFLLTNGGGALIFKTQGKPHLLSEVFVEISCQGKELLNELKVNVTS